MPRPHKTIALAGCLAILLSPSLPVFSDSGEQLHQKHCTSCHGSEMYTRNNRQVKSLEELGKQVRQCSYALETNWFDEDINQVSDYLNRNFYRF